MREIPPAVPVSKAEIEERKGDLQKVAEIRYSTIPAKRKSLEDSQETLKVFQEERGLLKEHIGPEEIATIVSRWTHIPISKMLQSEMEKLATMEDEIKKHVVGQDEAITAVSNALRRSRAGISEEKRPIGSFIFLGPTGVGKTELAKVLAQFMFDDQEALIRVDMSEYMEKHSVSKMIGSPPGYIGHDEAGQLTEKVRRRPYSAILFDEIEKAHPDVFNILLQVMDHATLTDNNGRKADFRQVVLIMTSNAGSRELSAASIGFGHAPGSPDEARQKVAASRSKAALERVFSPEFRNRLDAIVTFGSLTPEVMETIVEKFVLQLEAQLAERRIAITLETGARAWLAKKGFDPVFGARPLGRVIQREVRDPLTDEILFGRLESGSTVTIGLAEDRLTFTFDEAASKGAELTDSGR